MTVYGLFNDGAAVLNAQMLRQLLAFFSENTSSSPTALTVASCVRITATGPDALKIAAGVSGLTVTAQPGMAIIADATPGGGAYMLINDAAKTIDLDDADGSQARIDRIVGQVTDTGDETSTYDIIPITGTPAGSPSAPATPSDAVSLGTVLVPAGADAPGDLTVTDTRVAWSPAMRPYLGFAMGSDAVPTYGTSSTSFETLFRGRFRRRQGNANVTILHNTPVGSTSEVKILANSVQVGSTTPLTAGFGFFDIFGALPGAPNDVIDIELQARTVTGAGPVTINFLSGFTF